MFICLDMLGQAERKVVVFIVCLNCTNAITQEYCK